jgi:hypothetical protein
VRILLREMERVALAGELEIVEREGGVQLEAQTEMRGCLRRVRSGNEWEDKALCESIDVEALVILEFEALGAVGGDGRNLRSEGRVFLGVGAVTLAGFEHAGIDGLGACLGVKLVSAPAFQDDRGDAHGAVPGSEVRDGAAVGQGEDVGALLNRLAMVSEDLRDADAGVAVIDDDLHVHLFQREHGGVGLIGVGREQHAGLRVCSQSEAERETESEEPLHGSLASAMWTMPFSVPM